MRRNDPAHLTRRERKIMDILYELGEATAEDVRSRLPDPPSYSAARATLTKLERKGDVRHHEKDLRYVYAATLPREEARQSALQRMVKTFFDGSVAHAVNGLLGIRGGDLSREELDRLAEFVEEARKREEVDHGAS